MQQQSKRTKTKKFEIRLIEFISSLSRVFFNRDNTLLASRGIRNTIGIWDTASGVLLKSLKPSYRFNCISFSLDGENVAFDDCLNCKIVIWNVVSGKLSEILTLKKNIKSISFSPNGNVIACCIGKFIHVWDVKTGNLLFDLKGHTKSTTSASFSPNGKIIATGSHDKSVRLWDATNGKLLKTLYGHNGIVMSVLCSPDNNIVASANRIEIRLHDISSGNLLRIISMRDQYLLSFSADSKIIVGNTNFNGSSFWNVETGTLLQTSTDLVYFSSDGKTTANIDTTQGHSDYSCIIKICKI